MNPPDLRILAGLIALHTGVPADEAKRLRECPEHSLSLMILRVAMKELKRRGLLTAQGEDSMLALATPRLDPTTVMIPVDQNAKLGTVVTVEQVVRGIDVALATPATKVRFPTWFISDLWPGIMQRMAAGNPMTEREQAIVRRVLAEVST